MFKIKWVLKNLKYYEMCSIFDWEDALNRLNMWFKDASLKVKGL